MITTVLTYSYKGFNIEVDFDSKHEPDGIFFGRIKNNAGTVTERSHTSFQMCKRLVELKVDEFLEVVPTTWEELTEHLEEAYTWTNDRTEYYLSVDAVKKLVTNFLKSKGIELND